MRRRTGMAALLALLATAGGVRAQASLECERCHGEPELLRQHVSTAAEARQLTVPLSMLRESAHRELGCAECHAGFGRYPHPASAATRDCASCHETEAAEWAGGIHSGAEGGATVGCVDCHGLHDVTGVAGLRSGAGLRAMVATCSACHETQRLEPQDPHRDQVGCYSCHGAHGVEPAREPESWMARENQPEVCGACHDSERAAWSGDVHGQAVLAGHRFEVDGRTVLPPTCSSCHGSHPIATAGERAFSEAAVERCIACHEKAGATFFGSYHGKATAVGSHVAATCVDCHGSHRIFPDEDPRSTVAEANLVETCGACHPYARPAFVKYDSHPEPLNRERNPWIFWSFVFMNTVLAGTLLVFGAHTGAWWIRTMIDRRRGIVHGGGEE